MPVAPQTASPSGTLRAISIGGLLCGICDITAAFVVYGAMGARPIPLLQGIAAGILGRSSFLGGLATAALGLLCHFVIAFGAATVYVFASSAFPWIARRPLLAGPLYGIIVYFVMQGVVHISRAIHRPFSLQLTLIGIAIHIVCVGTPIALATRRYSPH